MKRVFGAIAAGLLLAFLMVVATEPRRGASTVPVRLTVDAARVVGPLEPLWGDHYDLSFDHLKHLDEPAFVRELARLEPRSLRCSVGRWEVGHEPPAGATSGDQAILARVEREFYVGPDDLAGADDPAQYRFGYLDRQLAAVGKAGLEPFLCFDYMPLTLARERAAGGPGDVSRVRTEMSFSNGIRTSPPAHAEVYARVVRNVVRHLHGRFGPGSPAPIPEVRWIEIGNEPDLADAAGDPVRIFWNGSRADFLAMYAAVARELAADPDLSDRIRLGTASFGLPGTEIQPGFLEELLQGVARARVRLDFVSYHSYADAPDAHAAAAARVAGALRDAGLEAEMVNGEWGRNLEGRHALYEQVDFGLFRARVLALLQPFGVRMAHEALLRDPWEMSRIFGMLRAGPRPTKPAAGVYAALAALKVGPLALAVEGGCDGCLLAAADPAGGKVAIIYLDGGDMNGLSHPLELTVRGLGFAGGKARGRRLELDDAVAEQAAGPRLAEEIEAEEDPLTLHVSANPGGPRLVIWELEGEPTRPRPAPPSVREVRAATLATLEAEERELAARGPDELARLGRAARDGGDPERAVRLLALAFRESARGLDQPSAASGGPDLLGSIERHRALMQDLVPLYEARREGHEVLALARSMRATLGGLMERAAEPALRQGLFEGWLKVTDALRRAYREHASAAAVARLDAESRGLAERVFGAGSAEAARAGGG